MRNVVVILNKQSVKKKKKQAQNGVTYSKPHVTKPRLNLITVSTPPEMES